MIDDTLQLPLPYVLTDGRTYAEVRWMNLQDLFIANERALIATGSAWEWIPWHRNMGVWE